MKHRFLPLIAIFLVISQQPAMAWGYLGHRIIGYMAEARLTPKTLTAIQELTGKKTIAEISTWADEIRSEEHWNPRVDGKRVTIHDNWRDYRNHRFWHYVTVRDKAALADINSESHPLSQGYLVPKMVDSMMMVTHPDAPKKERAESVMFLAHLVGDVHQPLHVGNGEDRGGNDVKVTFGEKTGSLHWIWDSAVLEEQGLEAEAYADKLLKATDKTQMDQWAADEYPQWVKESLDHRDQVYRLPKPGEDGVYPLDPAPYAAEHLPLMEQRMVQASVRLAKVLNDLFDPATK
ncbi:S1/P1 nuclease [Acanthopleuribacter pedis]|uniref:S1/P1 nuclease n=1 Tax=Acanthopleuribacter pedis TaxID=442870 RepID=A0A8J7QHJ0_9BACT|nr:S1/P1 nuclease [Acanthopleuribacter pedis]MBO1322575.1 S1/P1 nuclease [Acanthopleuribacter pedis]